MTNENCIIYSGIFFQIEWYFDSRGYSQAFEYFQECNVSQKRKFLLLCQKLGDFGKIHDETKFRNEGDKIFAFKPQPDRYLCFFQRGKKVIVTNGFRKRGRKMPRNEKELALKNMTDYLVRHLEEEE